MKLFLFSLYYCKLRLSVMLGFYKTANPLDWDWRWYRWQCKYQRQRNR